MIMKNELVHEFKQDDEGAVVAKSEPDSEHDFWMLDLPQERYCGSQICCVQTIYSPNSFAMWLGQMGSGLSCCFFGESACCILKSHPRYKELLKEEEEEADKICCITVTGEWTLTKPLCFEGSKPCMKGTRQGCCCANRCAIPCVDDIDVTPTCGLLCVKCCDCFPFKFAATFAEEIDQLEPQPTDAAFAIMPVNIGDLFLVCQFCCCQQSGYIPETAYDWFGCTDESLWCCCKNSTRGLNLPENGNGYEIFLCCSAEHTCIKPRCKCEGETRFGCLINKYACPPNSDVPCACVCCGKKCCGPKRIESAPICNFAKIVDEDEYQATIVNQPKEDPKKTKADEKKTAVEKKDSPPLAEEMKERT